MEDVKYTPEEAAFYQWAEEYRKGKPYWSTARVQICRDAWMERAKRDATPDLYAALQEIIDTEWLGGKGGFHRARAALAKARGES